MATNVPVSPRDGPLPPGSTCLAGPQSLLGAGSTCVIDPILPDTHRKPRLGLKRNQVWKSFLLNWVETMERKTLGLLNVIHVCEDGYVMWQTACAMPRHFQEGLV